MALYIKKILKFAPCRKRHHQDKAYYLFSPPRFFLFLQCCFLLIPNIARGQCPTISAILVDACSTEQLNEFVIIHAGGGFLVDELQLSYDVNNNIIGPENNDINIDINNMPGPPCGLQAGDPTLITGCPNIIPAGPGTFIPANSFVVLQTSDGANFAYPFSAVCGTQQCIYVIQSTCLRSAGGFTNTGAGNRTTILGLTSGCSISYIYNCGSILAGNGSYFIPPATYGNGGCVAPPVSFGNPPVTPVITGIPGTICQSDSPIALPPTQSGYTGNWSGTGVSGNTFNPSGLSGNITLTFTPTAGQCASIATTIIDVDLPVTPTISGVPASMCETDATIVLPTTQSGINGNWSGSGVSGNTFDPSGLSGNITLTFTPTAGQCATSATAVIDVDLPVIPTITGVPASICETDATIVLPTTQSGIAGNWSGSGVSGNTFDPSGLSGNITLTFTPTAGQCATSATAVIDVDLPVIPTISGVPASMCETDATIVLPTTQSGISGNWSGSGVSGNSFDPSGLSGNITLTFTPTAGQCATNATTVIDVDLPVTPTISGVPASMCETDATIVLPTTQSGISGNWSGSGVSGNTFDPSGLSGNITLTFTPTAGQCASNATTVIDVDLPIAPAISGIPAGLCETDAPVALPPTQSGITGDWSGIGVSGNTFDPSGLNGNIVLTFTPDAGQCATTASDIIDVHTAPTFSNLTETCDLNTQTYTVSFDIIGGDPSTYTVNGQPVGSTTFISSPINSGTMYVFDLDDENECGPVVITGSINCTCATFAGTMDFNDTPLLLCDSSGFMVFTNGDHTLDGDDVLAFILHTNPGTVLGGVIAVSNSTTFQYPAGIILNQTYYVSAVAGTNDGSGSVDLNDPCLSVSQGVPVIFYTPDVIISTVGSSCANDCFLVQVQFTGHPPFSLNYTVNTGINVFMESISGSNQVSSFTICPATYGNNNGQLQVFATSMSDSLCTIDYPVPDIQTIIIQPEGTNDIAQTLCPGESIVVNGTVYHQSNPVGSELLPGAGSNGCDSIVNISLSFYPPAMFQLTQTLCIGGSITVNGTLYNEANPMGMELLPNASTHGCDSMIQVSLSFNSVVTNNIDQTLCDGDFIVVQGVIYDAGNPMGSETFVGGSHLGCDSVVNINLDFHPPAMFILDQTLCIGGSITVNGTLYNEANPMGMELLPNASAHGCDSMIQVNLSFNSVVTNNINQTLCDGEFIVVQGVIYDAGNPMGSQTFVGGSHLGCDSVVNVNLSFHPPAMFSLSQTLCPGDDITINGTLYNQTNPTGIEIIQGAAIHGCDSVVNIDLTFHPPAVYQLDSMLQSGQSVIVNGTVYNESNPAGMEIITGGNHTGCDSIVNIVLTYTQVFSITISVAPPTCHGGNDGSFILESVIGGVPPFLVFLDGDPPIPVSAFPFMFNGLEAGMHQLLIEDAADKSIMQEIVIPDAPGLAVDLGGDQSIQSGESLVLSGQANFPVVMWDWMPPTYLDCTSCANPTVLQPHEDISYTLIVSDANGCTASDVITILVTQSYDIYAPTIFSPNGDGINDHFEVYVNQHLDITSVLCSIFDRWGNMVLETTSSPIIWDGTFKSELVNPGVYSYIIKIDHLKAGEERVAFKHGDITLIR